MRITRVFPRRTKATPVDDLAFIGSPDLFSASLEVDRVDISVTFSWDIKEAEMLYEQWKQIAPTEIGGPAMGLRGEDFTPGKYLKEGYVITSRGCANRCWFCSVWRREGEALRELPVTEGYIIQDDNLLSCSEQHIRKVFLMLYHQKKRPIFSGGLEARRLQKWHCEELLKLRPKQMFFAYDTPDDREPLFEAGKLLFANGFTRKAQNLRCYVLIGYPKDTFESAEKRLTETMAAGFVPFAMLYRDNIGWRDPAWVKFAWPWMRPAALSQKYKGNGGRKMIDGTITAEEVFTLIEKREVAREIGIKLIENYGIRQQQIALSGLQEEYGGYTKEIERFLKRINARLDELFKEITEVCKS